MRPYQLASYNFFTGDYPSTMAFVRNRKYVFVLTALMSAGAAQAAGGEKLPWIQDPFASDQKALSLVDKSLQPNGCSGTPDVSKPLSIQEVLHFSLCNNSDTKIAYLNLLATASGYGGTLSEYYFPVTAGVVLDEGMNYGRDSKPYLSSSTDASVSTGSVVLFDFGKREANIRSAERSLAAASYSYNSFMQSQITAIMYAYYGLLASQQRVNVAKESELYARESYEAAQLRYDIGQVPLIDVLQARGSYSQARLSLQSSENRLLRDQANMALLMHLKPDVRISVKELDDSELPIDPFDGNASKLMEKAKKQRYDLTAARASMESSEASFRALKRRHLPSITTSASAGAGGGRMDFDDENAQIGISVSIPIFTGLSSAYSETAARRRLSAQREQLAQSELNVERDVWDAWNDYQTAKLAWETSWDYMASATKFKEVALGRYKEGLGSILDVLSAQTQYSDALQGQLDTHYNLLTARIALIRAVGELDIDNANPENAAARTEKQRWNYD